MDLRTYAPEQRYSGDKATAYARYRPAYPPEAVRALCDEAGWGTGSVVADVGAGTGIFTRQLLHAGVTVYAVEPNPTMREEAARALADAGGLRLVAGRAEDTTLPAGSVDGIVCAQAFHWFDTARTVPEFRRVLRPGGAIGLIWNELRLDAAPFGPAYRELLRSRCPDYTRFAIDAVEYSSARVSRIFGGADVTERRFAMVQELTAEGLQGRTASLSYAPRADTPEHTRLLAGAEDLFRAHASGGTVRLEYEVILYCVRCGGEDPCPQPAFTTWSARERSAPRASSGCSPMTAG